MSAPLLSVEGLQVRFAGLTALSDASLQVDASEIVAVIGPNGAGKTTLFNAISGFVVPSAGRVVFRGEEIQGRTPHAIAQRGIRRTFQNNGLFGSLSVMENVLTGLHTRTRSGFLGLLLGLPRADTAERTLMGEAQDLLESLEIGHIADRRVADLSGGQQRIVEIARAIAAKPPLILLDEPAVGLSPSSRAALSETVRRLARREGIGILLIEHAVDMVMDLSDRVVVMSSGAKIAEGTPDAVRRDPAVLAAYLGRH